MPIKKYYKREYSQKAYTRKPNDGKSHDYKWYQEQEKLKKNNEKAM